MTAMTELPLLFTALAAYCDDEVLRRVAAAGHRGLRVSHGYVVQHVVPGPITVTALAARLGMTPQGASKAVGELERLGYLRRRPGADRRERVVELTEAGLAVVEATRLARSEVTGELRRLAGPEARSMAAALEALAVRTGALDALMNRRLRPR